MRPRISIAGLMVAVAVAAVGCVALLRPHPLWAAALFSGAMVALGVAALGAALHRGRTRAFCLGVLVFGGGYALLAFGPASGTIRPVLLTSHLLEALAPRVSASPVQPFGAPSTFVLGGMAISPHISEVGHALWTWLLALAGGWLGRLMHVHARRGTEGEHGRTRRESPDHG